MWRDKGLEMSLAQAITGDARSSYYIPTGNKGDALPHNGRWIVQIRTADFTQCTSITFKLRTSSATAFSSYVTLAEKTVLLADLVKDKTVVDMVVPRGVLEYIDTYYDCNGTDPDAGAVDSFITPDPGNPEVALAADS